MRQQCDKCQQLYNDEFYSTVCPHRGIGFCAVCDCTVCVCSEDTMNTRSARYSEERDL